MTPRRHRAGFTVVELLIVLTLTAVMLGMAGLTLGRYVARTTARRAAQVFAQDLAQARMFSVRSREPVVIRFFESTLRYEIATGDGLTQLVSRRFDGQGSFDLSGLALDIDGDSFVFSRRGIADLDGAEGPLGKARFEAGRASYTVSFNSLGASRIESS